jgi:hypothetical protein
MSSAPRKSRNPPSSIYQLYGLAIQSPLALPSPRSGSHVGADVRLKAGNPKRFARILAEVGPPQGWLRCRKLPDGTHYVQCTGLFDFLISPDGCTIEYQRQKPGGVDSFSVYLLGQILSFVLLARGVESLHGTVVRVDGEAIAFLGNCGYGKSTLAAMMLARQFAVLTDDLMVLEQHGRTWIVHPGMPQIKLFPAVARALLGSDAGGTPMNPGTSKLVFRLGGEQAARSPVPLKALYVLSEPSSPGTRASAGVLIEPLSGRDAFLEVIRAAFNLVVLDPQRIANQFAFATRLAESVPIRRLTYPRRLSALPEVCDAVLADLVPRVP